MMAITFFNAVLLLIGIPVALATGITLIIRAEKFRYEHDITMLEGAIKQKQVNIQNYLFLSGEFDRILRNNLDKKRTHKAYNEFQFKFREIIGEVA